MTFSMRHRENMEFPLDEKKLYSYIKRIVALFLIVLLLPFYQGCFQSNQVIDSSSSVSFSSSPSSAGKYRDVFLTDLDRDGFLDIVAGSSFPGNIAIFYGDGTGVLSNPLFLDMRGDVRSVVAADFNHDGLEDIAASVQREGAGIVIWEGRPERKWAKGNSPTQAGVYEQLVTEDINGDGHVDIIAANARVTGDNIDQAGGVQVWMGDGNGGWPIETGTSANAKTMGVGVADFNGDGFLDIVGASWGKFGKLNIWYGDGTGGWSSGNVIGRGSFYHLTTKDINADGCPDLLAGTYRKGVRIFTCEKDGTFSNIRSTDPVNKGSYWKAEAVNMDDPNKMEIVASSIDGHGLSGWQTSEEGHWTFVGDRFSNEGVFYGISIGDLNEDGIDDICSSAFGEGIKIWLGWKRKPGREGDRTDS